MELTSSFLDLLQHFAPVFTALTYRKFVVIVAGWVLQEYINPYGKYAFEVSEDLRGAALHPLRSGRPPA
jgi:hypothetical protein